MSRGSFVVVVRLQCPSVVVVRRFQWKYMVLVVEASQRFYVDLASHVTYSIVDQDDLSIVQYVHLREDEASQTESRLRIIANTDARGSYTASSNG